MWRRGWRRRGVTEPRQSQGGGTRRKYGAWIAVLVCVGGLAGYGALIRGRRAPTVPSTPAMAKAPEQVRLGASPTQAAAVRPSAGGGAKSKGDDARKIEIDFCSLGKLGFHADDPFGPGRFLDGVSKPVARRWLSALLNSDDNRARAAGLFLQDKIGGAGVMPMQEQARDALIQLAVGSGDPTCWESTTSGNCSRNPSSSTR